MVKSFSSSHYYVPTWSSWVETSSGVTARIMQGMADRSASKPVEDSWLELLRI